MIFRSDPVGLPGLAVLAMGLLAFAAALLAARRERSADASEAGAARGRSSLWGIVIQGLGFFFATFGPQRVTLDPLSTAALGEAAAITVLMVTAVALFVAASRAMGRNWSIRARTRADHALVQHGPFALVRNPIYVALLLWMVTLAIGFGHVRQLLLAVPLYALGTAIRIRSEEALLRGMFGEAYDAYAARVKRFVPGLF